MNKHNNSENYSSFHDNWGSDKKIIFIILLYKFIFNRMNTASCAVHFKRNLSRECCFFLSRNDNRKPHVSVSYDEVQASSWCLIYSVHANDNYSYIYTIFISGGVFLSSRYLKLTVFSSYYEHDMSWESQAIRRNNKCAYGNVELRNVQIMWVWMIRRQKFLHIIRHFSLSEDFKNSQFNLFACWDFLGSKNR